MHLTILGGTGRIGRLIVQQARAAGHDVAVLVRDPATAGLADVMVIPGNAGDGAAVLRAVEGADAIISALGPDGKGAEQVARSRDVMRTIIEAAGNAGVQRIVNLSGAAVDAPGDRKPALDRAASRIVRLFSGNVVAAKQAEFEELRASGLAWVAVRPPLVTDGPHTGRYRAGEDVLHPGARISRADIADFMLAQAVEPTFAGRAPFICYGREHR